MSGTYICFHGQLLLADSGKVVGRVETSTERARLCAHVGVRPLAVDTVLCEIVALGSCDCLFEVQVAFRNVFFYDGPNREGKG